MTQQNKQLLDHMFDCLDSPSRELTKWESDFIESVYDQFTKSGKLSDKQFEILEKIYAEKTS